MRTALAIAARFTFGATLVSGGGASAVELARMQEQAAAISNEYLRVWSTNRVAAVRDVPDLYGPRVTFYGKPYSQAQLQAEKERAIQRWPLRRYQNRPGSMQVLCNEATFKCAVRSIIDWQVSNPERQTHARGSSTFDLGISFASSRPVILYETGILMREPRSVR